MSFVLCWLKIVLILFAFGGSTLCGQTKGLILVRDRVGGHDEFVKGIEFIKYEIYPQLITVKPSNPNLSDIRIMKNVYVSAVIFPDLAGGTFVADSDREKLRLISLEYQALVSKHPYIASQLNPIIAALRGSIGHMDAGNVLRRGQWINKTQYLAEINQTSSSVVSAININGKIYIDVSLIEVNDLNAVIRHSGGTASFATNSLTPQQVTKLNQTSTTSRIKVEKLAELVATSMPKNNEVVPEISANSKREVLASPSEDQLQKSIEAMKSMFNDVRSDLDAELNGLKEGLASHDMSLGDKLKNRQDVSEIVKRNVQVSEKLIPENFREAMDSADRELYQIRDLKTGKIGIFRTSKPLRFENAGNFTLWLKAPIYDVIVKMKSGFDQKVTVYEEADLDEISAAEEAANEKNERSLLVSRINNAEEEGVRLSIKMEESVDAFNYAHEKLSKLPLTLNIALSGRLRGFDLTPAPSNWHDVCLAISKADYFKVLALLGVVKDVDVEKKGANSANGENQSNALAEALSRAQGNGWNIKNERVGSIQRVFTRIDVDRALMKLRELKISCILSSENVLFEGSKLIMADSSDKKQSYIYLARFEKPLAQGHHLPELFCTRDSINTIHSDGKGYIFDFKPFAYEGVLIVETYKEGNNNLSFKLVNDLSGDFRKTSRDYEQKVKLSEIGGEEATAEIFRIGIDQWNKVKSILLNSY